MVPILFPERSRTLRVLCTGFSALMGISLSRLSEAWGVYRMKKGSHEINNIPTLNISRDVRWKSCSGNDSIRFLQKARGGARKYIGDGEASKNVERGG